MLGAISACDAPAAHLAEVEGGEGGEQPPTKAQQPPAPPTANAAMFSLLDSVCNGMWGNNSCGGYASQGSGDQRDRMATGVPDALAFKHLVLTIHSNTLC